jgi:4-hydroxybenzoate polyprenyltransferase
LSVPQMYLGVTFGWGIPMAFAAQIESVPRVAWLLLLANVLWVTVYDTLYAMVDRDDDIKIGVRSTAILFGDSDRHIIAVLQLMTLASLYLVGRIIHAGAWYNAGLIAAALFFIYQLWLIRARDRDGCFKAFLNNNYVGMSVFIGLALAYLFAN